MTGEDRGIDRQGIYISPETAEQEAVPDELNADLVGDYRFPDPRRRRVAAWIYAGLAAGLFGATLTSPRPWWIGGVVAAILAVWHRLAAWPLENLHIHDSYAILAPVLKVYTALFLSSTSNPG